MKIKILGINCSPRTNSKSYASLDDAFQRVREKYPDETETEIVSLKDYKIKHCLACDVCGKTKDTGEFIPCNIQSDDVNIILDKMLEADGMLVATPVYFGLASDLFSKFIMRTRVLRHRNFALADKPVGIVAIAGRRSGGAETAITSSWLPFMRNGCLIVGNGDKTCQFGTMGWAGPRGHILTDEWGLIQARDTAERVFRTARIIRNGKKVLDERNYMTFSYTSGNRQS